MKKLFLVLAVASLGFVACNNEGETKSDVADTAKSAIDSTANQAQQSIEATADSAKDAIDSTTKAAKDTLKAKTN